MSDVNTKLTALANEIRELSGTTEMLSLDEMKTGVSDANNEVSLQVDLVAQIAIALDGKAAGSGSSDSIILQDKTVIPTTSVQTVVADDNYDGLSTVTVNPIPSSYIQPTGTKAVTTNGTHDVKSYASVSVNVASTGEDVTEETNAYTEKITQLTSAVTALETELEGKAGGNGSSAVETYDLVIQSDGIVKIVVINYISYSNGDYQYHSDTIHNFTYPITLNNVVLKTPVVYSLSGGSMPAARMISDIEYIFSYDYPNHIANGFIETSFFPLSSDNGQIILSIYDDD